MEKGNLTVVDWVFGPKNGSAVGACTLKDFFDYKVRLIPSNLRPLCELGHFIGTKPLD